eukprot:5365842-Alexandrium_andersonii.AAC.1
MSGMNLDGEHIMPAWLALLTLWLRGWGMNAWCDLRILGLIDSRLVPRDVQQHCCNMRGYLQTREGTCTCCEGAFAASKITEYTLAWSR